jgi:hypothetical protein
MPHSYADFKEEVKEHFLVHVDKNTSILDVGPGAGGYWELLHNHGYRLDAVEIHSPYVSMFELERKYQTIHIANIEDFNYDSYEYLIFGDILEHLSIESAQRLITDITAKKKRCLVAVPYQYVQGPEFDNQYETHIQDDLTPENMLQRYKELRELFVNNRCGYYVNYKGNI